MLSALKAAREVNALKKIIAERDGLIAEHEKMLMEKDAEIARQQSSILSLNEHLRLLRKQLFGRSSEKRTPAEERQALLFNEAEAETSVPERSKVQSHTRGRKRGRKPLSASLPRLEIVHDVPEEERGPRRLIGQDTSEVLVVIPQKVYVERHVYPKYAPPEGVDVPEGEPTVKTAARPLRLIQNSIASASLLAYTFIAKFCDHLPFHRQVAIFARWGAEIKKRTMCNWAIQVSKRCSILIDLLYESIRDSHLINVDETTLQVLSEAGRSNLTNSYMWVIRAGPPEKPVILFKYRETREARFLPELLKGFQGVLQTDGYEAYDAVAAELQVIHAGCWDHVRRKFVEAETVSGKSPMARAALRLIGRLYHTERLARHGKISLDELLAIRQRKQSRRLRWFKRWLIKKAASTPPSIKLGQAISYALNQWEKLIVFLDNPKVPLSNILVENSIRPFVVGRKNWLFSGSPRGAEASATLFTLIETAKANGLEPYWYLRYLFEKLPYARNREEIATLLPTRVTVLDIMNFFQNELRPAVAS